MDPTAIATIIGLAKTSVDTIGTITDVVKQLKKEDTSAVEYRAQIIKLYEQLLDAKEAQNEMRRQLVELHDAAEKDSEFLRIRALYRPITLEMGGVVLGLKEHDKSGELYERICPVCADARQQIVPVQGDNGTMLTCLSCKSQFKNRALSVHTPRT
jgi:hypothetical protein